MTSTRKMWAIQQTTRSISTGRDEPPFLLGIGYFGWPVVPYLLGNRTALFETRTQAQQACTVQREKSRWADGRIRVRVVRVVQTLTWA